MECAGFIVIETLETYPTEIKSTQDLLSPVSFFKNSERLEVEIGSGQGYFLVETGLKYPDNCYVGLESAHTYANLAAKRAVRRGVQNVRFLDWSAETLLPFFKNESVYRFHIYFPDPWPKRRHLKRRLWKGTLVKEMARILESEGRVYFATDYLSYFDEVIQFIEKDKGPLEIDRVEDFRFFEEAEVMTTYERKFIQEGRPRGYASFKKRVIT